MISSARVRTVSVVLSLLLASACSGGGGEPFVGSGTIEEGTGRFLLSVATVDELLSFSAEVEGVSVVYDDDTASDNLLSAPVRVELLSLGDFSKWIAQSAVEEGTIEAIQLSFRPFSYLARALDGTEIPVDALHDAYTAPLTVAEELEEDEVVTFVSELDLQDSLMGDVSDGILFFDPEGISRAAAPDELLPVDRFIGMVQLRTFDTLDLVVEAFADDQRTSPLGPVPIFADSFTLLMDRNLFVDYSTVAQFFTILVPGITLVEVHGVLEASGDFIASRIEIEDQDGGAGATYPYKLRGTVTARTAGVARLQIQAILRGAPFILPILEGLSDPMSTDISLSSQRLAVLLGNEELLPSSVLIGDELDIKFQVFPSQPFPAVVVAIRGVRPGFRGTITNTGGLPQSFAMNLLELDAGILGGAVASVDTDVIVDIQPNLTQIALATLSNPLLQPVDLVVGQSLRVTGDLTGTSDHPRLAADRILVRPGLLDRAQVVSVDVAGSRFTVLGGEVVGSFGGAFLESASYDVRVQFNATLLGEADGIVALAAALANLGPGEQLFVDVRGTGTDVADRVRAYQVLSFVE